MLKTQSTSRLDLFIRPLEPAEQWTIGSQFDRITQASVSLGPHKNSENDWKQWKSSFHKAGEMNASRWWAHRRIYYVCMQCMGRRPAVTELYIQARSDPATNPAGVVYRFADQWKVASDIYRSMSILPLSVPNFNSKG